MPVQELMYHIRYKTSLQEAADRLCSLRVGQVWWGLRRWPLFVLCLFLSLCTARPGRAETLRNALAQAYQSNPILLAAQARLRATDESVPQALGAWRPSMAVTSQAGKKYEDSEYAFSSREENLTPWNAQITLRQNLYKGGQTVAAVKRAEAGVQTRRAYLLATEQQVLFDAGVSYVDIVRDEAVLKLNENNERALVRQLQATRARFAVGEVTRTDVAQAKSRLSQATAERIASQGQLTNSRATYQGIIGKPPGPLSPAYTLGNLPGSLEEALATAQAGSPDVIAARFDAQAAAATVREILGRFLPSLDLETSVGRRSSTSPTEIRNFSTEVSARLTIPLYQRGTVSSEIREAKHLQRERRLELEATVRKAIRKTTHAWGNLTTARAQIEAFSAEIEAAEIALEGVRQEEQVGSRTILDVLDAEQELLDARHNLVVATRNEIVASMELRQTVGTLTARALRLPVTLYDPEANYRRMRGKWWGLGILHEAP